MLNRFRELVLAILAFTSLSSNAALIDNVTTTIDTNTGLEWLDLSLTFNTSYDQLAGGFGSYFASGYTHATQSQLCGFFGALGDTVTNCNSMSASATDAITPANADTLIGLLLSPGSTYPDALGIFDSGMVPTLLGDAGICASSNTGCSVGAQVFRNNDSLNSQAAADNIGHFLVRAQQNQIPIPGTLSIIGLGLVGLFWQRRTKYSPTL